MDWQKSSNGQAEKPDDILFDYECDTVYVRRNFQNHAEDSKRAIPEHWSYEEIAIPLKDWEYWRQFMEQKQEIAETQEAAVELAGNTVSQNSMIEELQAAIAELGVMTGGN